MILLAFLAAVGAFALHAFADWRKGIYWMILVAAIQDPIRKLVPGTPGWLALATVPIFLAVVTTAVVSVPGWWTRFRRQFPTIAKGLLVLVLCSLPAAAISATYGPGSWMLTIIGAFSYALIFLGVIAGYHFPRATAEIRTLLATYCVVHGVMLSGGIIEYLGLLPGWTIIGDDVFGFEWRRYVPGYIVEFIAGFYRSGDVMGWHAATVAILSLVLLSTSRRPSRWLWLLLSAGAVVALALCGRRKMVYMLPVFAIVLLWIYWQAGRAGQIWSVIGLLLIPAAGVWFVGDWLGEESGQVRYYTETSGETFDSLQTHGFSAVAGTYAQSGFFGEGLGTATPGSHHLAVARPRTWQESGPSRIMVELGVPGALAFLGVIVAIILGVWRVTRELLRLRALNGHYAAGLVAFFVANAGSLTVSGQILADPFIAAFLGFMVGLVLALARSNLAVDAANELADRPRPRRLTAREPVR